MATQPANNAKHTESISTGSKGNASNPAYGGNNAPQKAQLLDEKAETYLREGGNIEDMPDAQDEGAADENK